MVTNHSKDLSLVLLCSIQYHEVSPNLILSITAVDNLLVSGGSAIVVDADDASATAAAASAAVVRVAALHSNLFTNERVVF